MDLDIDLGGDEANMGATRHTRMDDPHYLKLVAKSKVPLYDGSELSRLTRALMLLNTCATHWVINGFVDELFSLLCNYNLPKPNKLPRSHYEAKRLVQNLGLRYSKIHACKNGCVLFCD
jgi:hypothetical protein